jgi:hypothetical protein
MNINFLFPSHYYYEKFINQVNVFEFLHDVIEYSFYKYIYLYYY